MLVRWLCTYLDPQIVRMFVFSLPLDAKQFAQFLSEAPCDGT